MADKTPEPGLLTIDYAETEETTDPTPFGPDGSETTKRRCGNCGVEIGYDDHAFRAGARTVLNAAFASMLRGGVSREEAAAICDVLAKESGVELV